MAGQNPEAAPGLSLQGILTGMRGGDLHLVSGFCVPHIGTTPQIPVGCLSLPKKGFVGPFS